MPFWSKKKQRTKKKKSEINERKSQKGLVSLIKVFVHFTGLWMRETENGFHWSAKLAILFYSCNLIAQYIYLYQAKEDTKKFFEGLSLVTFSSMAAFKLNSLRSNNWRLLMSQIATLEFEQVNETKHAIDYESDEEGNKVEVNDYIKSYTNRFKSISTNLFRIYAATLSIFIITPFVQYAIWKIQGQEPGYPHLLPSWSPLEGLGVAGYVVNILCELIASVYCVCVHTAFDMASVGLMVFVCGQFSWLRDYSGRIGGSGNNCLLSKERDDRAHYRIVKCHRIHMILIHATTELNKLIRNTMGIYYLVVTLTLCSIAVRLVSEELSEMELISLLQYMSGITIQLFLFCYYGSAVLYESSVGMGCGPYGAACWALSPHIRQELHLLSMGMARTRRLQAGPFNSLDLPSFVMVGRTAYSYYAVIRK